MPSATSNSADVYPPSMEEIKWADLVTLDLSKFDQPGGKQELAKQVVDAVRTSGFFSVKNSGITSEAVEQQRKLAKAFFDLPLEEKLKCHDPDVWASAPEKRWGYRPIGGPLRKIQFQTNHKDNLQVFNILREDGFHDYVKYPDIWREYREEMKQFHQEANKVAQKILRVLAVLLELPDENQFAQKHEWGVQGEDLTRFLKYQALPVEVSKANDGIYANKHTDISALTLNFEQPIAGLQILDGDGEWKWLKPWEDQIVVNCGDALAALSGGYFKSGVHRMHAPPKEQIHLDRYAVLFFARPNSDSVMESVVRDSPVLNKEDTRVFEGVDQGLNGGQWAKAWIAHLHRQDEKEVAARQAQ